MGLCGYDAVHDFENRGIAAMLYRISLMQSRGKKIYYWLKHCHFTSHPHLID